MEAEAKESQIRGQPGVHSYSCPQEDNVCLFAKIHLCYTQIAKAGKILSFACFQFTLTHTAPSREQVEADVSRFYFSPHTYTC